MDAKDAPKNEEEMRAIATQLPEGEREKFVSMMMMFRPWEELDPELRMWVTDGPFGRALKHPLVFDVMYSPGVRDGHFNDMLKQKRAALARYAEEGNWSGYVWMFERPHRLEALIEIKDEIEDDCKFWELVGDIWTDTENARQNYDEWAELLHEGRSCRESMMDEDERKLLASLPDEIEIWRGFRFKEDQYDGIEGFSWTLDKGRAEWFARRFAKAFEDVPVIAKGRVRKENVIAYFAGRGEQEIVALPEYVEILERQEV